MAHRLAHVQRRLFSTRCTSYNPLTWVSSITPTLKHTKSTSVPTITHNTRAFHSSIPTLGGHNNIQRNKKYKHITAEDISHFISILGQENVLTDSFDIEPFNQDWMRKWKGQCPVVLKPATTDEVSKVLSYCNQHNIAVIPQGGNTGLVGGSIPIHDELVLSLTRMNKIIHLNRVQGIVTVDTGVVLETLTQYLEQNGFTAPIDLGAKGSCHIGGNAATNAGGLRYVRYGSLRGSILGMEAVLADGTVIDTLTSLRKDNTGYDLKQLFIGSEGSLGVITKLSILVPPKPNAVNVMYLSVPSFDAVMKTMALARTHLMETLSAIEFQDSTSVNLVLKHLGKNGVKLPLDEPAPFYMLIETAGGNAEHNNAKIEQFFEACMSEIPDVNGTISESEVQSLMLWKLREGVAESAGKEGYVYKYDISLPVELMWETTLQVKERLRETGAIVMGYGHLGDGNLHLNIVTPGADDRVLGLLEPW